MVFRHGYSLCKVQFLAGRVDWVGIGIDSINVLATFLDNLGILL